MSTIDNGGPAFPMQEPQAIHTYAVAAIDGITDPDERDRAYTKARAEAVGGMSLRDYFAAKAMQAFVRTLCDKDQMQDREVGDLIATLSYVQADAMIKAREVSK